MKPWREWHGGPRPVSPDVWVEVRFEDGSTEMDVAGVWDWSHMGACDIHAYREWAEIQGWAPANRVPA